MEENSNVVEEIMKDDFEEGVKIENDLKNQTKNRTVKMNRKTDCLNKTVKRTKTNPKSKTETDLSVLIRFF